MSAEQPITYWYDELGRHEANLVYETWTRDYSRQPSNRAMPAQAYYPYQREIVKRLLDRGAQVLVARDAEDPGLVYGWLCCETSGREFVLHYVYVKLPFRECGIGHGLLAEALERYGAHAEELVYTHDPARGRTAEGRVNTARRRQAEALGFTWRPVDEHLRQRWVAA